MSCTLIMNSCSNESVMDGASRVILLTDRESSGMTDNSAMVYVGHDGPNGPSGEIHEIHLNDLARFETLGGDTPGISSLGTLDASRIDGAMTMSLDTYNFLTVISNPVFASQKDFSDPASVAEARAFFSEHDVVSGAQTIAMNMNDERNMMAVYEALSIRAAQDPEFNEALRNNGIDMDYMNADTWAEEWANFAEIANGNLRDAEKLETADDHRVVLTNALEESDFALSAVNGIKAQMGVGAYAQMQDRGVQHDNLNLGGG